MKSGLAPELTENPEASSEQIARFKKRIGPAIHRPFQQRNASLIPD